MFEGDRWLCTAKPQNAMTPAERDQVLDRRRADVAEQARRQRRASRQARARLAAMTEPGDAEVTTTIAADRGRAELGRADDLALRRQARIGLLDLDVETPSEQPGTP